MADYVPRADADFVTWINNFITYANGHLIDLGLVAADTTPLVAAQSDFTGKLALHTNAQQTAQAARQAKDDSRKALELGLRALVRRLQASPAVSDTERVALGITVADGVRTAAASMMATRPLGSVDTSQRLRHEIRFSDEATPTRRAKPDGVMGCEIWVKVTNPGEPAPAGSGDLTFVALDTASPYVAEYDGKDGGKTAHYMLRWVTTSGDKGPWSETVSATISA